MPRKNLIRTDIFPYHITSRANHKWWFNLPMDQVWKIFELALIHANSKHPIEFHGAVCMSNHYHMVIRTPEANIDKFMFEFNSSFSKGIRQASQLVNRMLGKRYHWSIITHRAHYHQVMKYIYRNPIKGGITDCVQSYPYSTLYHQCNQLPWGAKIESFEDYSNRELIEWMNETHSHHQNESIKVGLKKKNFKFGFVEGTRKAPEF